MSKRVSISRWGVPLLLAGLALPAWGTPLTVTWEYDKALLVGPWKLMLARAASGEMLQDHLTLTPLDEATCRQRSGDRYTPNTWCAEVDCPGAGAYVGILQSTDLGEPSDPVTVGIRAGEACALIAYDEALLAALPAQ